jgi:hypothetical protein
MGQKAARHRIHLIHWKPETAQPVIEVLRTGGFSVTCTSFAPAVLRDLTRNAPAAIVIDLTRLPASGRDVGVVLRRAKGTRHIPLVFAGGAPVKVQRVRAVLPDVVFASWQTVGPAVRRAMRHPPPDPTVPPSSLAGYAGTPLLKKLGIDADMTVGLIDAPRNVRAILGPLPKGVQVVRGTRSDRDLTLWFVTSQSALAREIQRVAATLGTSRLWIAWPKRSSGLRTDLTQNSVRQAGLSNGLVDFKICAIDATWTGLKFVRRKR